MTRLEDLSNEIFFEICDYLHALDIFTAFSTLNQRITLIISSIPLRIVVSSYHCHRQIKFLSSYLIGHAHQVVSISLEDSIRDFTSVISFFFIRHTFENLELCALYSSHWSIQLRTALEQLKNLIKLRSLRFIVANHTELCEKEKQYTSQTILAHQSSSLRSLDFVFCFNHSHLTTPVTLNWTLTSMTLTFYDLPCYLSIYCVLHVFHIYRALRRLRVFISIPISPNIQHAYTPTLPTAFQDNLPVLPYLKFFDLQTTTMCNIDSISVILRCMPNLRQFVFTLTSSKQISRYIHDLLDGYGWQQILTSHASNLKKFDFLIGLFGIRAFINMDYIVHSFQYFVAHYDGWHMTIERSRLWAEKSEEYISLRTLTYSTNRRECNSLESSMVLGTLHVQSTLITDDQYHNFHQHNTKLEVIVPINMAMTGNLPFSVPFQNVQQLVIVFQQSTSTLGQNLLKFISMHHQENDEIDSKQCVNVLKSYVDLSTIKTIDFEPKNDISQLHCIEQILLLELLTENVYFSLKYVSKLIQRFSSLTNIQLEVYSFDTCARLVDILLDGLVNLLHLKIDFVNGIVFDNSNLRDHVIEKRHQAFPFRNFNKDRVVVILQKQSLEIYLE
ncbi:unnamed protein product [Rotaria sp. Silwood2]|nr:unnamed protein product [Rotaria sp. Silwood2]CAF4060009.1 unnamed protein product [Rotaria sp. Silwood2]